MTTSKFPDDMFEMETPRWRTLEYNKYVHEGLSCSKLLNTMNKTGCLSFDVEKLL